ncbi:MAG: rhomboid family intramembrane serine protease [Lachnospiraceae bacterium]|nr:rhomboid family intramembrane serine protease [Lachnospiraceae bacterium]
MERQRETDWRGCGLTLAILAVNIIAYIVCTQTGEVVYNIGSMNAGKILDEKQYYRFVTCIFLHADIDHIVSNMIYLAGLGQMIEPLIGHIRFGMLYLLSGLCGSVFSFLFSVLSGDMYDAVGASGAIFGLIGALFILVAARDMRRRSRVQRGCQDGMPGESGGEPASPYERISVGKLVFVVAYMIYSGARSARVDNAAHVGGLVCGLLVMAVMNLVKTGGYRG